MGVPGWTSDHNTGMTHLSGNWSAGTRVGKWGKYFHSFLCITGDIGSVLVPTVYGSIRRHLYWGTVETKVMNIRHEVVYSNECSPQQRERNHWNYTWPLCITK